VGLIHDTCWRVADRCVLEQSIKKTSPYMQYFLFLRIAKNKLQLLRNSWILVIYMRYESRVMTCQ